MLLALLFFCKRFKTIFLLPTIAFLRNLWSRPKVVVFSTSKWGKCSEGYHYSSIILLISHIIHNNAPLLSRSNPHSSLYFVKANAIYFLIVIRVVFWRYFFHIFFDSCSLEKELRKFRKCENEKNDNWGNFPLKTPNRSFKGILCLIEKLCAIFGKIIETKRFTFY